jgi:uncharacterized protein with FMN-binding domain
VRTSTKTAVGVISLGILGLSYQLGSTATASTGGFAAPVNVPVSTATESAQPAPSVSSSPSASASQVAQPKPSASKSTAKASPNASASASASASTAPAPAATQASNSGTAVSKTGAAVESGFGVVQVKVTKVDNKIIAIDVVQANATHGRAAAFPYLVQYAIQANGANFGNLSGATYTTNAFKQSLESALAKF